MNRQDQTVTCPVCGRRSRNQGFAMCGGCKTKVWAPLLEKSVKAAQDGDWDKVMPFEDEYHFALVRGEETLAAKREDMELLSAALAEEEKALADRAATNVAMKVKSREGGCPKVVRDEMVKNELSDLRYNSEIVRRHYGLGKAVESLEAHLQWLSGKTSAALVA